MVEVTGTGFTTIDVPFTCDKGVTGASSGGSSSSGSNTTTVKPPVITSAASADFTVGTAGSFTMTTSGDPKITLTETGTLPTGVTFVDNKNGIATLSGTPAAGTNKTYTLTITASNGTAAANTVTQSFTLTVKPAAPFTVTSVTCELAIVPTITVSYTFSPATTASLSIGLYDSSTTPKTQIKSSQAIPAGTTSGSTKFRPGSSSYFTKPLMVEVTGTGFTTIDVPFTCPK
jgi:hypothetical protein